jgi:hypothetical protein
MKDQEKRDWLLFAAILIGRDRPMAPHHVSAVRERLGYATDEQLIDAIRKGVPPNAELMGRPLADGPA